MLSDSPEGTKLSLNLLMFGFLIDILNIVVNIININISLFINISIAIIIILKQAESNHHLWQ